MELSINLQEPFSHSTLPILIIILVIVLFIGVYIGIVIRDRKLKKIDKKEQRKVLEKQKSREKIIEEIKEKFIVKMRSILEEYNQNKCSLKKSYQKASKIIRQFVTEISSKKVTNKTLEDIQNMKLQELYDLINKYYKEEFSYKADGSLEEIINKSCEVIKSWK